MTIKPCKKIKQIQEIALNRVIIMVFVPGKKEPSRFLREQKYSTSLLQILRNEPGGKIMCNHG
jgi:hypothetical protein